MAGPSIVRITWPDESCWATTITGPRVPLAVLDLHLHHRQAVDVRQPLAGLGLGAIPRHGPPHSVELEAAAVGRSSRVSSSAGFGSSTDSAAAVREAALAESARAAAAAVLEAGWSPPGRLLR